MCEKDGGAGVVLQGMLEQLSHSLETVYWYRYSVAKHKMLMDHEKTAVLLNEGLVADSAPIFTLRTNEVIILIRMGNLKENLQV